MKRSTPLALGCLIASLFSLGQTDGGLVTVISAVGKGVSILNGVKGLFTSNRHRMTDITPPGLHFDFIDDDSYCQLLQRMKKPDFDIVVADIAEEEFEYPQRIKNKVMRGKRAPVNKILVSHFRYEVGKGGSAKYGFIATLKHEDNTFDLAVCMQSLNFKLAPRKILHEKKTKVFGMTTSESTWIEYVETSLSQDQKEQLEGYLRTRLFKTFTADFSNMLPGEKHQPKLSFCTADDQDCL